MDYLLEALETMPVTEAAMCWGTLGTVRPFVNFRPERDARALAAAMTNKDVNTLVRILTNRTNAQRQQVAQVYRSLTNQELVPGLKKVLSGGVQAVLLGLMMTPPVFDAHQLRNAMEGLGTDEQTLAEILCTRSPEQLQLITATYREEFQRSLEEDVRSETSQGFRDLLLALLQKQRENIAGGIEYPLIQRDAKALVESVKPKSKPSPEPWIRTLTHRDADHLNRVFDCFQSLAGRSVEETVQAAFSGDLRLGLLILGEALCVCD
ncbi:ANXA2 protein, partial [Amia calva]|nr:ANXA2 protein [Amia calva]